MRARSSRWQDESRSAARRTRTGTLRDSYLKKILKIWTPSSRWSVEPGTFVAGVKVWSTEIRGSGSGLRRRSGRPGSGSTWRTRIRWGRTRRSGCWRSRTSPSDPRRRRVDHALDVKRLRSSWGFARPRWPSAPVQRQRWVHLGVRLLVKPALGVLHPSQGPSGL